MIFLLALTLALTSAPCTVDQCDGALCTVELPTGELVTVLRLPGMAEGGLTKCPTTN